MQFGGGGLFGTPQGGGLGGGLTGVGGLGGTGGGLFGTRPGGSLFGGGTMSSTGGGLFSQTPASQSGGLFSAGGASAGGMGTGGGLFQSPQGGGLNQSKFSGGLFGQTPTLGSSGAATGLGLGLGGGGGLFSNSQTTSGLFKSQTAATATGNTGNGLFQTQNKGIGLFGGAGIGGLSSAVQSFKPIPGSETVNKNGVNMTVSTVLHCISAMSQYDKSEMSLEEIRVNDYMTGRKGGSGLQAETQQTLGGLGGGGLFGGNKTLGGGLSGGGGLFGGQTSQALGALGTSTSTTGGLFGNAPKLGGGLLNTSTQNPLGGGLGTGGLFNQSVSQSGGLFGNQTSSVGGAGLFNQTSTNQISGLGGSQLGGGLLSSSLGGGFGQTGLQSSQAGSLGLFNKNPGLTSGLGGGLSLGQSLQGNQLGASNTLSLGRGLSNAGGLGGAGLSSGFNLGGVNKLGGGGLFAGGFGTGVGMSGVVQQNTSNGQLQSVSLQQQQAHLNQQLENLANSPFGDSPLFRSALLDSSKLKSKDKTTPVLSKPMTNTTPHYKLNMRPSSKLKPVYSPSRHHERSKLFEGFDNSTGETFVPRSVKKLTITPKPSPPMELPDLSTPPFIGHARTRSETPPTESHAAAFPPTPTPPHKAQDTSVESPQITVGATPLKRPVPIKPKATPPMVSSSPVTSMSVEKSSKSPSNDRSLLSPEVDSNSLTRTSLRRACDPQPLRPCRVTLSHDYCTVPPLDELDSITDHSRCLVLGFTVSRCGFGEVHFPGTTDVFGMDLEKLVSIGFKEVVVYPDDADKPAEGQGLNKTAIVKLERNWPVDKRTREVIRDTDRIEKMGYRQKLIRMTEKMGGDFRDYDPVTGTCVFQVNHFSKYKLVPDDEDSDENEESGVGGVKKTKTQGADPPLTAPHVVLTSQQAERHPVVQHNDQDEAMSDQEEFEDEMGVANTVESRPLPLPMSQQLVASMGVRAHNVQVMKASFFGSEETSKPPHPPPYRYHSGLDTPASYQSPGLLRMSSSQQTTPLRARPSSKFCTPQFSEQPSPPAVLMAKCDLETIVPRQNSLMNKRERLIADHGLFTGHSFRVGWGPNWTMAHSGIQISTSNSDKGNKGGLFVGYTLTASSDDGSGHPIRAVMETVRKPEKGELVVAYYSKFLEVLLTNTDLSERGAHAGVAQCATVTGTTLLHAFVDLIDDQTVTPPDGLAAEQLKRVLKLSVALWGDLPGDCDPDPESYKNRLARRRGVYQWLKDTNSYITKQCVASEHYLKALFSLVAGQQLSEACKLAHEKHDHKLALLLSQATQNTILSRVYVHKQLKDWRALTVDRHIDQDRLRLYAMLAGVMVWEQSPRQRTAESFTLQPLEEDDPCLVNVCEGLDWKRSLAVHLCYASVPSARIDAALSSYENAFQGDYPYATPPFPPYLEDESHVNKRNPPPLDTCFHLLQLYCNREHSLEETLNPASSTPDHLDYGVSWLLWAVLTALGYTHMQTTRQTQLHTSFSSQLEHDGAWQWAVFVLQHIADPVLLQWAVRELLARNCSSSAGLDAKETFVIQDLHVLLEWVYVAKALRARYDENHNMEAWHLIEAGQWNDAHIVIIKHLAADAIINDETEDLAQMLEVLSDPDRFALIQDWDLGGSVFLDFLHIGKQLVALSQSHSVNTQQLVEELHLGLKELVSRISQMDSHTPKEVLCQAEVAKRTADYTKLVLSLKHPEGSEDMPLIDEYSLGISRLALPSDYALTEYRTLIQPCLRQLSQCY